ncbi:MAG: cytidylate kinase-like family protein [Anaerolineae bacterium]|nr:cytidylate kinase-like family protein [Anaerolineae bacterium]
MAVITISRQYGSGGDEIAQRLCEILGYQYFDKKMMLQVAEQVGLSEHELVDFSEENYKVRGFFNRLFAPRAVAQVETWTIGPTGQQELTVSELNEVACINMIQSTVRAAHKHGNVVILGRGGQAILRDMPDVLHVRIEATLGARVMRVQAQQGISISESEALTRNNDQTTAAYLKNFYGIDWADPLNYHLVLNSGKWGVDASVQIIVNALSHLRLGLGI